MAYVVRVFVLLLLVGGSLPSARADAIDDLAARGQALVSADPLAAQIRSQFSEIVARGFDIGMAAAEGHTLPGPGKQRTRSTLGVYEQRGFDIAVEYSLARNSNAAFAATGAAIAGADPVVAAARAANQDGFFRLGFDIATGIFGDPAQGASGNTATGPGSLKIRDGLNAPGRTGFDASVKLHFSRNYLAPSGGLSALAIYVPGLGSAVVISQVYGGGGSVGATFANDFVELLNRGEEVVDIGGWSIQYAAANGSSWQATPLTGTILPGQYLLIQEFGSAASGLPLPAPDLTGRLALGASAGKVALVKSATAVSGYCPTGPDTVDFIGYGNANCFEGSARMREPGAATAALRNGAGCIDTDQNATDFQIATPQPRNRVAAAMRCAPILEEPMPEEPMPEEPMPEEPMPEEPMPEEPMPEQQMPEEL